LHAVVALVSLLGTALLCTPLAWTQPTGQDSARAIHAAVLEVEALAEELRGEQARLAATRDSMANQGLALELDVAAGRASVLRLREELAEQQARAASARARSDATTTDLARTTAIAQDWVQGMKERAQRGTPSTQAHGARLATLAAQLAANEPEALGALARHLGEVLPTWRRAALSNQRVRLPGTQRERHAWVVRIGAVGECFVTEDDQLVGLAARQAGKLWVTFDAADQPQMAAHIRELRRQLNHAETARMALVPLSLGARSEKGQR
jgi:hypothetical protein